MILQAIIIITLGLFGPTCNSDETLNLLTAFENACPTEQMEVPR